jgi:hypothetical protein
MTFTLYNKVPLKCCLPAGFLPSQRWDRKELKKRERKGLTKGEGSGILTKLSARNGVPAWAAAGTTEKTFEKLEKRA